MKPNIFIDGEAGTTGLQIFQRLKDRDDLNVISLDYRNRKNFDKRSEAINDSDLVVLCLPDNAAKEAVDLIINSNVRVLDASSAHRTSLGWVYGLPELNSSQSGKIAQAKFVTNPGCYPTGAVALLYPLIASNIISKEFQAVVSAVSGYSGGGKISISCYEDEESQEYTESPLSAYALHMEHKHIREMQIYSQLKVRPIFLPAIGRYRQGIILRIPIFSKDILPGKSYNDIRKVFESYYKNSKYIKVVDEESVLQTTNLDPTYLNNTNNLHIYIFHNSEYDQIVLTAIYDNLGKGASGAAVQNLNLMLGLTE